MTPLNSETALGAAADPIDDTPPNAWLDQPDRELDVAERVEKLASPRRIGRADAGPIGGSDRGDLCTAAAAASLTTPFR